MTIDELVNKYPKIFTIEKYPSIANGWIPMLDLLCTRLQEVSDDEVKKARKLNESAKSKGIGEIICDGIMEDYQIYCSQCKEKFGGLRFYTYGGVGEHLNIIREYEVLSYHVCESCGTMMDVGLTQGWLSTVCINCKDKPEYKRHDRKWIKNS